MNLAAVQPRDAFGSFADDEAAKAEALHLFITQPQMPNRMIAARVKVHEKTLSRWIIKHDWHNEREQYKKERYSQVFSDLPSPEQTYKHMAYTLKNFQDYADESLKFLKKMATNGEAVDKYKILSQAVTMVIKERRQLQSEMKDMHW